MTEIQDEESESNGAASANGGQARDGESQRESQEATSGSGGGTPPPVTPEERIVALEVERDETRDRMLRIAADFENWKKRARKEQGEGEARVREGVLKDVLEVVDNLERATSAYSENGKIDGAAVLKGVNLVLRLFQSKLERYGVRPFEAKGQPFDPREHEAISQIATADVPPGTVAQELQKGYRIGDKLLRPASVAVATAPTKGEGSA